MLCLLERVLAFPDLESEILNLKSRAESISRQLGAWIRTLRDSEMRGQRFVTEKTRRPSRARQEHEEFVRKLEQIRKSGASGTEKLRDEASKVLKNQENPILSFAGDSERERGNCQFRFFHTFCVLS
jgi:hypothetical protein